tara:strand:+ start:9615 stop:10700 length:1086 start_codon:yes stop_codon:yes gene_type:complete
MIMIIDLIVGARPNFVKIVNLLKLLDADKFFKVRLIHTGQHYANNLSDIFFKQLNIRNPDFNLKSGSGSQSFQTAKIMLNYEKILKKNKSNYTIVVGDVNSTLACSLVAKKFGIKVIHIESGLRSYDISMPEEINRIVTDSITDIFFTTSIEAKKILISEGKNIKNIYFVGNTMIDTLKLNEQKLIKPVFFDNLNLSKIKYLVVTMHRPSNVDNIIIFEKILKNLNSFTKKIKIIFSYHPRISKIIKKLKLKYKNIIFIKSLSYLEFNYLVKKSNGVITDSGGITEETTYFKIPCITMRNSTERPETINIGSNILINNNFKKLSSNVDKIIKNKWKKSFIPNKWDGNSSFRIYKVLKRICI